MPHRGITLARVRNNLFQKSLAPVKHCRRRRLGRALAKSERRGNITLAVAMAENHLTRCAELYTRLPQTRIDHGRSLDRLRNAGLCHFLFHLAEGGVAKCSFLIFLYHNPVIMTRAARRETVN